MRTFLRMGGILASVLFLISIEIVGLGKPAKPVVVVSDVLIEKSLDITPRSIAAVGSVVVQTLPTRALPSATPDDPVGNPRRDGLRVYLDPPKPTSVPRPLQPFAPEDLFIHLPPDANAHQPLRVLVALHGVGVRGDQFAPRLIQEADANGWVLIAPTMRYRDWTDPVQLLQDDLLYTRMVYDTLEVLPARLNLKLRHRTLVFGFSRGAQLAERLTLFYPERIGSVAIVSAGAYTLPSEKKSDHVIALPYGVGDMPMHLGRSVNWDAFTRVSFWIGVGERDNRKEDVPRVFDQYGGSTRIERAQVLMQSLRTLGMDARLMVFPNTDHEITNEITRAAMKFLHDAEIADNLND